jgi:acetyl esterase/lipase
VVEATRTVKTADLELILPPEPRALLVLFPGFGDDTTDTRTESRIVPEATANGVAVILMALNRHLYLRPAEMDSLVRTLTTTMRSEDLQVPSVVLGGFSAGGNMATLLAEELVRQPRPELPLKGLFVVDAPLDLARLYDVSAKYVHERNVAPPALGEADFLVPLMDSTLGNPKDSAANYLRYSPVSDSTSLFSLKTLPIRLYAEPDTAWWRINRNVLPADLNATRLAQLQEQLRALGNARVEYITTKDRGMQHGQRHPHAWSIVEEKGLLKWVLGLDAAH